MILYSCANEELANILSLLCVVFQSDDEVPWQFIQPDIFATIMDFFTTDQALMTEELPNEEELSQGN